jgi:tetratricopeptide (TPR) repeat protein
MRRISGTRATRHTPVPFSLVSCSTPRRFINRARPLLGRHHLEELAHHYSRSDNAVKAVEYLGWAGQQALHRSAYADAISNLSAALNLLKKLPNSPENIQQELLFQLAAGPALIAIKGYAAPEVERAYTRARELCEQLGDTPEIFLALFGLWLLYLLPGELRKAYEIAEELLKRAQGAHDQAPLIYAQLARGLTSYWIGDFIAAREHLESAIPLYDPKRHRPLIFLYGLDARIVCFTHAAWALWQLGYPDQAIRRGNEALVCCPRNNFTCAGSSDRMRSEVEEDGPAEYSFGDQRI